jgi:D-inositol-3-phosphate glycosyltransferase
MHIAMISYHTCPLAILGGKDTGGMNVYVRELTRFLGQIDVHVDVFTRSQDEHVPHVLHDLGYGNRVVHVNAGQEVPLPKECLAEHIPEFARGIMAFSERKGTRYDMIHSHYWMSGIAAGMLKDKWHVPVVQMFHTLGKMKNKVARSPAEMEGAYRLEGEKSVMQLSNHIVAATPAEVEQLTGFYQLDKGKITIIPPGVDTSHFYPIPMDEAKEFIGVSQDSQIILFAGRIEPLKGVDVLIRAIAKMKERCHMNECPFSLVIIGGDVDETLRVESEISRLKSLCQGLGLSDMVVFLGRRDQDTLPYYYSAAEMVVMPSHYESFGMVALESMACGTPVVASQIGGLAYLVQDGTTGFTVKSGDVDALAMRLTQLLSDVELRQKMGQQATEYARDYAWEKIALRVKALYEQVIHEGS